HSTRMPERRLFLTSSGKALAPGRVLRYNSNLKRRPCLKPWNRRWIKLLPLLALLVGALILSAYTVPCNGFTLVEWWAETHSRPILYHASASVKVVALTFDDGPDPSYTPRILAILKRYHVKATFFQQARMLEANPALARRVVAEGHVIGNHTVTHPY